MIAPAEPLVLVQPCGPPEQVWKAAAKRVWAGVEADAALQASALDRLSDDLLPARWLPPNWHNDPTCRLVMDELHASLARKLDSEPDAVLFTSGALLPLVKEALAQMGLRGSYLIAVDEPSGDPWREGAWLSGLLSALKHTQGERRRVVVLDSPTAGQRFAESVAEFGQKGLSDAGDLFKNSKGGSDSKVELISLAGRALGLCRRAHEEPRAVESSDLDSDIDALWTEWSSTRRMISPPSLPSSSLNFSWSTGFGPQQVSQPYLPMRMFQTVRKEVAAPPGAVLGMDLYHSPCRVTIRRALWRREGEEIPAEITAGKGGFLEELDGERVLTVFGPNALTVRVPAGRGPLEFEVEMFVDEDVKSLNQVMRTMAERMVKAETGR